MTLAVADFMPACHFRSSESIIHHVIVKRLCSCMGSQTCTQLFYDHFPVYVC